MKLRHFCFLFAMFATMVSLSAQAANGFFPFPPMSGVGVSRGWNWQGRNGGFRGVGGFQKPGCSGGGWNDPQGWESSWIPYDTLPSIGPSYAWIPFWDAGWSQSHQNHRSADFVERWLSQAPGLDTVDGSGLSRSPLLSKGMDAETVLRLLGSPIRRDRFGRTDVWRYSSYSLTFEGERLVKLR